MVYSDLVSLLEQDCNCAIVEARSYSDGTKAIIIENCSNGLVYPVTFHPDWEVFNEVLSQMKEELRLNPHPYLNLY